MNVTTTERFPIKCWATDIEEGAMKQALNLANLPFLHKWVALMPDCHQGYGMPIGGVIATKGVVIPNAVGVDIGCGMCYMETTLEEISPDRIKTVMGKIRDRVPLGFKHHDKAQSEEKMPEATDGMEVVKREYQRARHQLGTLGGGNHFIEIQRTDTGKIAIMIHSGSRNIGLQVAKHHNAIARELNSKWFSAIPDAWELAFLPLDSIEGQRYLAEMHYCVDFALANRMLMMENIKAALIESTQAMFGPLLNIAHNYAALENHHGSNVMVHRKGATRARGGERGIIPGSQGTASYIVEGLGNQESFFSCSHGAGRAMGRKQAQRELSLKAEQKLLDDQGIVHSIRGQKDLDEAAGAYKDIDTVMENQKDLVKIIRKLQPLAVIKG